MKESGGYMLMIFRILGTFELKSSKDQRSEAPPTVLLRAECEIDLVETPVEGQGETGILFTSQVVFANANLQEHGKPVQVKPGVGQYLA